MSRADEPRRPVGTAPDRALQSVRLASCPDDETLARRVHRGLEPDRAAEIDAHVDRCSTCYAVVVELGQLMSLPSAAMASEPASTIGRYEVVRLIGVGGAGAVYEARDPSLERRVAIKVLRATRDRPRDDEHRLRHEARAIARLDHPNIVAVYDVGRCDGRTYLVMEFVDGMTLDHWLENEPRDLDAIVDVFVQIATGVGAAHEAGLVHRDIKPHNVLIGRDGRARVVDFGLAVPRADCDRGSASTPTAIAGTPRYMAPEQFLGRPATPSSDQFSLCVALYEALWRTTPFETTSLRERMAGGPMTMPSDPKVPGPLRRVILRGLSIDPDARYPTVAALRAALVRAKRSPARRSRTAAIAAAVVVLGGLGLRPAASSPACPPHPLSDVWNADQREALRARWSDDTGSRAVEQFSAYAGAWTEAWASACAASGPRLETARECLEAQARRFRAALGALDDGGSQHDAIAAWSSLSHPQQCLRSDRGSLEHHATAVELSRFRRALEEVTARVDAGDLDGGLELARQSHVAATRLDDPRAIAAASLALGYACKRAVDNECAREALSEAYFSAQRVRADEWAFDAALQLLYVESNSGNFEAAEGWAEHLESLLARTSVPAAASRVDSAIGVLLDQEGRYDEAAKRFDAAWRSLSALLGPDHPWTLGARENHATMLRSLGRLDEASEIYAQTHEAYAAVLGPEHPSTIESANNLGGLLDELGAYRRARRVLEAALAAGERTWSPEHPKIVGLLVNLAAVEANEGEFARARAHLERGLAIAERDDGLPMAKLEVLVNLATLAAGRGDHRASEALLQRAWVESHDAVPAGHPIRAFIEQNLDELRASNSG